VGNAIPGREIEVQSAVDGPLYRWEELTPIAQQTERATVSSNDSWEYSDRHGLKEALMRRSAKNTAVEPRGP